MQCGVTTVAMQSTGVYWIPLYEILDARGLEVYLVNARHTKNLPGRKSDVQESQWLLKLHTYGLLRNSFHPPAEIRVVRTYWRQRGDHVHAVSTCIQRMQKALTQMNIQLANVISDLSGWTGQRIVRAILAGERDPDTLAALSHPGIHATRDTIAKSLEGTWQPDLLFVLQQEVAMYDAYQQRIAECDQALEQHLKGVADKVADTRSDAEPSNRSLSRDAALGPKRRRKAGSHAPQFDLGRELHRISGVDLTRIDGIDVGVAQTVISEVGVDMTRWKAASAADSAHRKRSPPWPTSSPAWSIACSSGDTSTSTKACSTTKNDTANNKCTCSRSEPRSSVCKSSNPRPRLTFPTVSGEPPLSKPPETT